MSLKKKLVRRGLSSNDRSFFSTSSGELVVIDPFFSSPEEAVDCSKKGDLDRGRIQRNSVSSQGGGFAYPEPAKMRIEVSKMGMGM